MGWGGGGKRDGHLKVSATALKAENLRFLLFFQCFRGLGVPGESKNSAFSHVSQGFGVVGRAADEKTKSFGDGLREPKP